MNNDLISREALKKAFEDTVCIEPMPYAFVKQIIDNAPTVEPEITNDDLQAAMTESYHLGYELAETKFKRSTGEWIKTELYGHTCLQCNQCGKADFDIKYDKYCPNCGAKMDRKKADNE